MQTITIEKHLEEIQEADERIKELETEYSNLEEDYEDLKQEYAEYKLRNNKLVSSLRNICEATLKEDQKIKRDSQVIVTLSFILIILVALSFIY